jgi:hypothetical protein
MTVSSSAMVDIARAAPTKKAEEGQGRKCVALVAKTLQGAPCPQTVKPCITIVSYTRFKFKRSQTLRPYIL